MNPEECPISLYSKTYKEKIGGDSVTAKLQFEGDNLEEINEVCIDCRLRETQRCKAEMPEYTTDGSLVVFAEFMKRKCPISKYAKSFIALDHTIEGRDAEWMVHFDFDPALDWTMKNFIADICEKYCSNSERNGGSCIGHANFDNSGVLKGTAIIPAGSIIFDNGSSRIDEDTKPRYMDI